MTPAQRAAAQRLAGYLETSRKHNAQLLNHTAALLRELVAEPVKAPVAYIDPRQLARGCVSLHCITRPEYRSYTDAAAGFHYTPVYLHPAQQSMRCPEDGGECGAGGYCRPERRRPAMQAEIECDCLTAWNASTYGHSAHDTVHPIFLSAFLRGYRAAERAHGIGEPT